MTKNLLQWVLSHEYSGKNSIEKIVQKFNNGINISETIDKIFLAASNYILSFLNYTYNFFKESNSASAEYKIVYEKFVSIDLQLSNYIELEWDNIKEILHLEEIEENGPNASIQKYNAMNYKLASMCMINSRSLNDMQELLYYIYKIQKHNLSYQILDIEGEETLNIPDHSKQVIEDVGCCLSFIDNNVEV